MHLPGDPDRVDVVRLGHRHHEIFDRPDPGAGAASTIRGAGRSSAHAVSRSAREEPSAPTTTTFSELVPTSTPSQAGVLTLSSVAS